MCLCVCWSVIKHVSATEGWTKEWVLGEWLARHTARGCTSMAQLLLLAARSPRKNAINATLLHLVISQNVVIFLWAFLVMAIKMQIVIPLNALSWDHQPAIKCIITHRVNFRNFTNAQPFFARKWKACACKARCERWVCLLTHSCSCGRWVIFAGSRLVHRVAWLPAYIAFYHKVCMYMCRYVFKCKCRYVCAMLRMRKY